MTTATLDTQSSDDEFVMAAFPRPDKGAKNGHTPQVTPQVMTQPDKPNSNKQKYRRTAQGQAVLREQASHNPRAQTIQERK